MIWSTKKVNIDLLKPYEHNPRSIKGKKFNDLKESIEKFGLAEPIVVNTDMTIIGGHARYFVLRERGETEVDVYVPDRTLNEQEVKELNIRLNKNIAGEWDFDILANAFDESDLFKWGFEEHEIGVFNPTTKDEQGDIDKLETPEPEQIASLITKRAEQTKQSIDDVIKEVYEVIGN